MHILVNNAGITGPVGPSWEYALEDWRRDQAKALKMPGVLAAAPYIEAQALLMHGQHTAGTEVRGVEPEQERRAVGLAQRIEGARIEDLSDGSYRIRVRRGECVDGRHCDTGHGEK